MTAKTILKMGNPILREVAEKFSKEEITSPDMKFLLEDMWDSLCLLYTSDAADDP